MPALPDFGTEQSDSSKLPDFGEALPDFGEPSPAQAPDLSQIKPSPVSEIEAPATAEPLSIMSRGGPSVFDLAKGAMSIAGKVGGGLIRTATQLVNPETWQPNEERIRQNASFGESPQQTAQRLDQQDPLKYEIQPGSPDENNELKRLLSRWTGAEGLSQFAIAANPVGGITMLTAMVPDLLGQVRDAVGGKGTDDEKRDRINDLMTLALLHAGKKTGELTGQQLSEGNRIANQPPLATGEVLSTPKGSAVPPKVPFELPNAARAPEPPVVPTAPPARTPMTQEEHASVYPVIKSDALVDGREQLNPDRVPNVSSIESSIDNPQILPGIREVPMSDFTLTGKHYSVEGQKKIDALAESIKDSGKISPLIVVRDSEGAYILEGATRADALFKLGAKSFPAKVVLDIGDIEKTKAPVVPTKAEAPPVAPVVEAAAKPEVATLGGAKSNNKLGDPMGTTYHATPEDWAKWQELLSKPLMEEGVWPAREALKNAYGGMPPEAPKVAAAPPAPAADRWTKLYAAEHADLLDAQRRMEEARQYQDADAEKQAKQERDDILQRLAEFDKLSKRPGIDYFSPPKDLESMTIMLLRDNPRLTLAEAAADAQERIAVQPEHEVVPPSEDFPRAKSVVKESSTTEKPFVDEIRKVINNPNNTRPERNFAPGVSGDQNAYTHTTRFTSGSQSYVAYLRPEKHNTGARSIFNHPAQLDVYHATDTNMARPLARIDLSEISKATIEETSKPIPPPAAAPVAPIEPSADLLDIKRERGIWRATWKDPSPQSGVFFHEVKSSKFPTLESAKTEFSRQIELAKQRRLTAAAAEAAHAVAPRQARTAPSGMTGMGGAVPSEFGGNESFVSNMFAAIDRDRAEMGKPPMGDTRPHTWDEANQKALAMMNQNPNWIPDLLDKMEKNPRPLSQEENAAVVWHRAKLKAEYNNSLQRIALAFDDNRTEDLTAAKVDAAVFEDKLARLDGIVGRNGTGSEAGRRLQALKMGAGDDFTLVEMTLQKRAAVGGRRLTPEETSSIQKDVDRLNSLNAALEKSLADSDAKASAAEAERAIAELKIKDIPTFDKRILVAAERMVARLETVAKPHAAQLREMMSRMSAGVDPTLIYHAAFVGSAKIARLGLDLAKFTDEMVSDFSEKIRPMIPEIWAESNKMLDALKVPNAVKRIIKKTDLPGIKQDAANAVKEKTSKGELSKITWEVQKLARALVSHGITDREELITAVHEALAKAVPGLTRRKTMDMISGYGDYRRLSKDVISVQLRGMKGEMLELAKLEDMASGQPPLKSGVERGETTEVRRKLIQLVNDAKNKFQVPIENPETQLKSSLDTLKTALKNRITDYQDRLERKDYAPRPRREVQMDTEATRLRADAERIKKRWRESLLADRMKNRTRWEKALDWGTKFRRFTALSSPAVIPKLFGAAGWRAVFTVAEDVSGGVLGRVPGLRGISQRAPLEGAGGQLSATMRGFGAAFTQGLKDTAKVIKTGHSDIDVLYGKASESYTGESEMASVLLGLPGRLHGAIKAPVKRGMFEKATQRLGEYYARQALDVTSDPVKYKIAIEAYKAGNRSIFLQDNRVASGFNAALQALEKKGETGHPSPGGKVLATTARFMFPVTKVPTNIAAETLQYTTGSVTGSVRAINAIRKGLDNLTPDQADLIMRELKKGYVGLALLYLGYMGYKSVGGVYEQGKKRQPGDVKPDAVRIFGEDIPGNLLHHPSINTIQLGATIHRTAEDKLRRKDPDAQGITAGVMAASWGLAEEVPFIQGPSRLFQGLKSPYTRQQTVGNEVGSIAIPQAVTWLAQVLDERRETPPTNFYQRVTGPPARLKPANVLESLKTRIPGLRQQVPLNPKGAPTAAPAAAVPPWDQFRK
jgi:hypothetical protein